MGQSYASFQRQNFFNSFQFVQEIQDPEYGTLYIFKNKMTQIPVFVQEIGFDVLSADDAQKYRERFYFQHKYILDIYNIFETTGHEFYSVIQDRVNYDSKERLLLMVFEYFSSDLDKKIKTVVSQGRRFSEEELWQMARQLFSAAAECQEHGIPLANISISKILVDENGDYQLSLVQPLINFLKHKENKLQQFKQDTLDLGNVLVQCSLLNDYTQEEDVKDTFIELKQYYSPEWVDFIKGVTDADVDKRPDPLSIRILGNGQLTIFNAHEAHDQYQLTQKNSPGRVTNQFAYQPPVYNQYFTANPNMLPRVNDPEMQDFEQLGQTQKVQISYPKKEKPVEVKKVVQYVPKYQPVKLRTSQPIQLRTSTPFVYQQPQPQILLGQPAQRFLQSQVVRQSPTKVVQQVLLPKQLITQTVPVQVKDFVERNKSIVVNTVKTAKTPTKLLNRNRLLLSNVNVNPMLSLYQTPANLNPNLGLLQGLYTSQSPRMLNSQVNVNLNTNPLVNSRVMQRRLGAYLPYTYQ